SRNAYLDETDRRAARVLSRALAAAQEEAASGGDAGAVHRAATDVLATEPRVVVDYVALVDPGTAQDVGPQHRGEAVLAVAGRLGTTRLIDNVVLDLHPDEET